MKRSVFKEWCIIKIIVYQRSTCLISIRVSYWHLQFSLAQPCKRLSLHACELAHGQDFEPQSWLAESKNKSSLFHPMTNITNQCHAGSHLSSNWAWDVGELEVEPNLQVGMSAGWESWRTQLCSDDWGNYMTWGSWGCNRHIQQW